jgi:replication factor C large subunit
MRLSWEVDDTPETIEQWVEGSVHLIPDAAGTGLAYRYLSRADEYLGNTYRPPYHTLWRYATAIMLLGVADAAGGKGLHARIMPPERWQKMSTAKKQKSIRISTLNKVAGMMHIPQNTLREQYLGTVSQLIEHDPAGFARDLSFVADQLNFFLADKARSTLIIKTLVQEEKEKEKELQKEIEKKAKEEKKRAKTVPAKVSLKEERHKDEIPKEEAPKEKLLKENIPQKELPKQEEAVSPEPVEKKTPVKTQSTLFDGF